MFHDQRRECRRGRLARRQHASLSKPPSPIVDLPARRSVLARNLGHLGTGQQTLGDDPSSLSFRTHAAPRRSFKNFQPAHQPRRWVVQMDVLFAVQSHPKPPSKPEASSHSYPYPEAWVPAKRLPTGTLGLISSSHMENLADQCEGWACTPNLHDSEAARLNGKAIGFRLLAKYLGPFQRPH